MAVIAPLEKMPTPVCPVTVATEMPPVPVLLSIRTPPEGEEIFPVAVIAPEEIIVTEPTEMSALTEIDAVGPAVLRVSKYADVEVIGLVIEIELLACN